MVGLFDKETTRLSDFPNKVGLVEIRVEPVFVHSDVEVDDVSLFEWTTIGDAVADDLVHGTTCGRRYVQRDLGNL